MTEQVERVGIGLVRSSRQLIEVDRLPEDANRCSGPAIARDRGGLTVRANRQAARCQTEQADAQMKLVILLGLNCGFDPKDI